MSAILLLLSLSLSPFLALPSPSLSPLLSNLELVGAGEDDCGGEEVKQCWMAALNTKVLDEAGMVLPGGQEMLVEAREGHTIIYIGDDMSRAVLTHRGGKLYGTVSLGLEQFRLGCKGEGKVMWSMLDGDHWGEGEPLEEGMEEQDLPHLEEKRMGELFAFGNMDRKSLVVYTVTVYYTKTLARETHDLATFIDQVCSFRPHPKKNVDICISFPGDC